MSAYLGSGPYTCHICKQEYDIVFADPRIFTLKGANPEFARFDMCDSCGVDEAMKSLIKYAEEKKLTYGNFHAAKKLSRLLEDWYYAERDKCGNCKHERDGCQYHDADD